MRQVHRTARRGDVTRDVLHESRVVERLHRQESLVRSLHHRVDGGRAHRAQEFDGLGHRQRIRRIPVARNRQGDAAPLIVRTVVTDGLGARAQAGHIRGDLECYLAVIPVSDRSDLYVMGLPADDARDRCRHLRSNGHGEPQLHGLRLTADREGLGDRRQVTWVEIAQVLTGQLHHATHVRALAICGKCHGHVDEPDARLHQVSIAPRDRLPDIRNADFIKGNAAIVDRVLDVRQCLHVHPRYVQPEVQVSRTVTALSSGRAGVRRCQIHCANTSLVGFSSPSTSLR